MAHREPRPDPLACFRRSATGGRPAAGLLARSLPGLAVLALLGCQGGEATYLVSGQVTWEDQPVEKGHIVFVPHDRSRGQIAGPITQGKYQVKLPAGRMRVEIDADRAIGPPDPEMGLEVRASYIPEEYNVQSQLEVEITPQGPRSLDFSLPE